MKFKREDYEIILENKEQELRALNMNMELVKNAIFYLKRKIK